MPTYIGLTAIGRRMGWSAHKVPRMCVKYGFPLMRLPGNFRGGWAYHTTDDLIARWEAERVLEAREHLLGSSQIRRRALREKPPDTTRDCVSTQQDQVLTQPNTTPDPGESDV